MNIRVHTLFLNKASEGFTVLFIKCKTVCTYTFRLLCLMILNIYSHETLAVSTTLSDDENLAFLALFMHCKYSLLAKFNMAAM